MQVISPGEILYFKEYQFDTGEIKPHNAVALAPHVSFVQNSYFCVITSKIPHSKTKTVPLIKNNYPFFTEEISYACFDRVDLQRIDKSVKRGELTESDFKKGLKAIYVCVGTNHVCYIDSAFRAAILRLWIKKKNSYRQTH